MSTPWYKTTWSRMKYWHAAYDLAGAVARPLAATQAEHAALTASLPLSWDEAGYLTLHPDVARNVLEGLIVSGYAHWLALGYREGRALPCGHPRGPALPRAAVAPFWDDAAYLAANPHAEVLVALGCYVDGLAHFWAVRDTQTPRLVAAPSWDERGYLWLHEDIAGAVREGAFASGFAHYVRHGATEGRPLGPQKPALGSPPASCTGAARDVDAGYLPGLAADARQAAGDRATDADSDADSVDAATRAALAAADPWLAERLLPGDAAPSAATALFLGLAARWGEPAGTPAPAAAPPPTSSRTTQVGLDQDVVAAPTGVGAPGQALAESAARRRRQLQLQQKSA